MLMEVEITLPAPSMHTQQNCVPDELFRLGDKCVGINPTCPQDMFIFWGKKISETILVLNVFHVENEKTVRFYLQCN